MAAPEASASWGSQLDLAAVPPQEEDVLELDYRDDEDGTSELLISEDEEEDDIFIPPARAAQPAASVASWATPPAHQLLPSPARTCSTCANAPLPGWPSPGPLS